MKIKKLKKLSQKLSIFVMAFALMASLPAFCDYTEGDQLSSQTLNLTVDSYFTLDKASSSNLNAVVSYNSTTNRIDITTPISLSYNVDTNDSGAISISATAPTTSGAVNALFGSATNAMKIVFTKSDSTATSAAVTDASSSSPTASSNINAVAFTFTPESPTATIGTAPTPTVDNNALVYSFNAGTYSIPLKVDGSSLTGTYSSDDVGGEYKATLIVSKVDT